ncbi:MAG: FAD-dependent oxidoreductase [Hyphomicrobium sp.]
MPTPTAAPVRNVLLLGGGHAHVFVLKAFGMNPVPGVHLTVVAKELAAPYSGMLPGFVAGHYTLAECQIDLVELARFAGARLIHGAATGIDRAARLVHIDGQPSLPYDLLSIDVGITPALDDIRGAAEHGLVVKPVSVFAPKWQALESRALQRTGPRRIAALGGGAAGVELVLAARHRLRTLAPRSGIASDDFTFAIVSAAGLLPSHNPRARALAKAALDKAGVEIVLDDAARAITPDGIDLASGRRIAADAVLVSTRAAPPGWFATTGLPRTEHGFLATRPTLQLLDDTDIFAVGDCATVVEHPREKSGVFAVRQGPVVAENLRRRIHGQPARAFVPQRQFLTLVSLGEKRAIAARGSFAVAGRWAWRWKDWIDRAFMRMFNVLPDRRTRSGKTQSDG